MTNVTKVEAFMAEDGTLFQSQKEAFDWNRSIHFADVYKLKHNQLNIQVSYDPLSNSRKVTQTADFDEVTAWLNANREAVLGYLS